ncbi:hypothetical protein BVRB_039680, partial [Beta vulgaris subsp. vulgaris]
GGRIGWSCRYTGVGLRNSGNYELASTAAGHRTQTMPAAKVSHHCGGQMRYVGSKLLPGRSQSHLTRCFVSGAVAAAAACSDAGQARPVVQMGTEPRDLG